MNAFVFAFLRINIFKTKQPTIYATGFPYENRNNLTLCQVTTWGLCTALLKANIEKVFWFS